jgi:5-methylthioribose kinase
MAAYPGLLFGPNVEGGKEAAAAAQKAFMAGVKADTLGFMGCEMIRRVVRGSSSPAPASTTCNR